EIALGTDHPVGDPFRQGGRRLPLVHHHDLQIVPALLPQGLQAGDEQGRAAEGEDDGGEFHLHSISTRSRIAPLSSPGGWGPWAARTSGSPGRQSKGPTSTTCQTRSRSGCQEASSRSPSLTSRVKGTGWLRMSSA